MKRGDVVTVALQGDLAPPAHTAWWHIGHETRTGVAQWLTLGFVNRPALDLRR